MYLFAAKGSSIWCCFWLDICGWVPVRRFSLRRRGLGWRRCGPSRRVAGIPSPYGVLPLITDMMFSVSPRACTPPGGYAVVVIMILPILACFRFWGLFLGGLVVVDGGGWGGWSVGLCVFLLGVVRVMGVVSCFCGWLVRGFFSALLFRRTVYVLYASSAWCLGGLGSVLR